MSIYVFARLLIEAILTKKLDCHATASNQSHDINLHSMWHNQNSFVLFVAHYFHNDSKVYNGLREAFIISCW